MYEKIPKELKALDQWVTVGFSKVPMQTGVDIPASPSRAETWCSFERAVKSVADGERSYIGFCFNNNGIVGIDIDKGFAPDGLLSALAVDCINACKSYTEKSKSGRGVHILVKGGLPFDGRNNGNGVEIYQNARYFITTGNTMIYTDLIENQPAIDYILEKYFPTEINTDRKETYYKPSYNRTDGKIAIKPTYRAVEQGSRHQAMVSLTGQLYHQGKSAESIYEEVCRVNTSSCTPPLPDTEIKQIVKSIFRYDR